MDLIYSYRKFPRFKDVLPTEMSGLAVCFRLIRFWRGKPSCTVPREDSGSKFSNTGALLLTLQIIVLTESQL